MSVVDSRFPARGVAAWLLGCVFFFYAFGLRVSPSVMVDELMRDFGVSALVLGNLSAFYFYAYASVQIPVGLMMDRFGPRRLMSGAVLVCALGITVFALSTTISHAYIGRALIGLGCAFSWVGVLTVIAHWLPARNFAAFTGGGQFAGTAGALAGQAPLGIAVDSMGWRNSMLTVAVMCAVLGVAMWLVVRDRPPVDGRRYSLGAGLKAAASNPQTWIIGLIGMSLTGSVLAFAGLWGVPWLRAAHGLDRNQAAQLLSLVFIGWLIGAPLLGWLSDRLQRRRVLLSLGTAASAATITTVLYWHSAEVWMLGVLLFCNGLAGSTMILTFAAGREHNPDYASGAALGVVNTFVVASGALFQPLIGWLLDMRWDGVVEQGVRLYSMQAYNGAMIVVPAGALIGFLLTLVMREALAPK